MCNARRFLISARYTSNDPVCTESRDRRSLDKNTEGWISLTEKQVVPAGPKQCDTIQAPVEMVMSQIKRAARAELPAVGQRTGMMICNAIRTGAEGVSIENVKAYWAHATKAIKVWAARDDVVNAVRLSMNGYTAPYVFKGTHGGWVPKILRA